MHPLHSRDRLNSINQPIIPHLTQDALIKKVAADFGGILEILSAPYISPDLGTSHSKSVTRGIDKVLTKCVGDRDRINTNINQGHKYL